MQRVELRPGERFGDFLVERLAGSGGMGVVYRATQISLERPVALKIISPMVADSADFRERFEQESKLAAGIDDPHVVSIYAAGAIGDESFIAMQWIDGLDLRAILARRPDGLDIDQALLIAAQIAQALETAHRRGLVHRDVKPSNILVRYIGSRPHAYLTDFGVAKALDAAQPELTRTGHRVGTSGFMAPEQIMGREPDGRADLYALGCVLFECLTGQRPFPSANENGENWAHAHDPRPRPGEIRPELDARYDEVLARVMAIDPDQRYKGGRDFAAALEALSGGMPVPDLAGEPTAITARTGATQPGRRYESTRVDEVGGPVPHPATSTGVPPGQASRPRRRRHIAALAAVGVVALAGVGVGAVAATGGFGGSNEVVAAKPASARIDARRAAAHRKAAARKTAARRAAAKKKALARKRATERNAPPSAPITNTTTTAPSTPTATPTVSIPDFSSYTAFGYRAELPAGGGWSAPTDSQPTPGQLFRTSVRSSDGQFLLIDYTPKVKPGFVNPYISKTEGPSGFGSATAYVYQGGSLPECQQSKCVDYIVPDPNSAGGYAVLAGGPDFNVAQAIAARTVASMEPYGD